MSDDLNDLIKGWTVDVDVAPPADLRARVWREIDARRTWRYRVFANVERWCAQPRMLVAGLAFALLLGVAVGELQVREQESRREREMAERYLSMLDSGIR